MAIFQPENSSTLHHFVLECSILCLHDKHYVPHPMAVSERIPVHIVRVILLRNSITMTRYLKPNLRWCIHVHHTKQVQIRKMFKLKGYPLFHLQNTFNNEDSKGLGD
jgi:hypothetical protein